MTHSTEQDILDMLTRGHQGSGVNPLSCKLAIDLITRLRAEGDVAAQEAVRWKGVAKIEAEGRQRMTELGQQAYDQAHVAARDMRERVGAVLLRIEQPHSATAFSEYHHRVRNRHLRNADLIIDEIFPSTVIATDEGPTA